MAELNLDNIEKLLDKRLGTLASKEDLKPLATQVGLNSISERLDLVAANTANLVVDMAEVKTEVKETRKIVDDHTDTLDKILATTNRLDTERLVESDRIKRLENWAEKIGSKLGIKLEV